MFTDPEHNKLSLQDCCNDIAQQSGKSLSKVALHNRFNQRSLHFLKLVLAEQMACKLATGGVNNWEPFSRVMIADSCKFGLPEQYQADYPGYGRARSKALMNIQYAFDLKNGDWETLELTKATQNDMAYSKNTLQHIRKGDLHIRDLGYVTHDYLSKVVNEKAFFLNRLHPKWNPRQYSTGKPVDWAAVYQWTQKKRNSYFETVVTINTEDHAFNCRLIAIPVPEQVWAERIRKAQKQAQSHGYQLSDEYKQRCRLSLYITNTEATVLKTADVAELYRLRWQIELIFKTWKSLLSIHKVKAVKKDRLECQLIAKFIWILLNWKIFRCIDDFIKKNSTDYACSMWKFFKQTDRYKFVLRKVVAGSLAFKDYCEMCIYPIIINLTIEPKKNKKAAYCIINHMFNLLS